MFAIRLDATLTSLERFIDLLIIEYVHLHIELVKLLLAAAWKDTRHHSAGIVAADQSRLQPS